MKGLLSLLLASAVCQAVAVPLEKSTTLIKRQGLGFLGSGAKGGGSGLAALLAASTSGTLGKFMGEPEATEALTALAKMLGANKNSPGGIQAWTTQTLNPGYGITADPAGAAPKRVVMKSRTNIPGAETIKVRYGPYKIPSMAKKNMLGEEGMLSNFPHSNFPKPCTEDCTIMGMSAGLEYPDGKNANIDTGMWLHHMVLFNIGPGREDLPCSGRDVSVPHATIGATPRNSERIFASGNERTQGIFSDWGVKDAGYKLNQADKFAALVEIMNENMEDKVVYMTVTYDIIPGHPFKDDIRIVWFDIRQCGTSEANPPKGQPLFTLDYNWTATYDGEVIGAIGHLHDGGANTKVFVDDKQTCDNVAQYGTKPEFVQTSAQGHHAAGATTHISDMNVCHGDSFIHKQMRKGQKWNLKAYYDFTKFKGMQHEDGSLDEVMGIEIMFVRRKG